MKRLIDEAYRRARLWQQVTIVSERLRLIEGIKRLSEPDRVNFAPWIEFLEQSPEEYPRLKRDMERIGFDLQALMALPEEAFVELRPIGAREVFVRLSPHPANDSAPVAGYRKAANFSTSDQAPSPTAWHGRETIGGDSFEMTARPDPFEKRVQIVIWFDELKSLGDGSSLLLTLPGQDKSVAPFPVKLRAVGSRIQGELSVAMAWSEFVANAGNGVVVSIAAGPPA